MQKEYLILFSILISFIIGLFVYLKERNRQTGSHFLIFAIIITLWSISLYFYNNPILLSAFEWLKITLSLTIVGIFELFCFIIVISNISFKKFKIPLIISFILSATIILALFVSGLMIEEKSYLMMLHPQSAIFFLLLFIYGAFGTAILFERSLKSSGIEHLQAMYILVGFGFFIISITCLNVFIPLLTGSREYLWLGPIFALFLVGSLAFAIIRYYLSETRVILMKLFVGAIGTTLLILPFLIPSFNLKILTTIIFLLFCILGYYLIKITHEESKRREEAERLAREWEKLARAKNQFLLSLQHHLRTPLTPIKGYLERILEGTYGREENPVIKEKLIEIKKLADTLYSLMEGLLDVQGLKVGKRTLNLEDCQIGNLIEGIVEELRPQAEQKSLYLKFERASLPTMKLDKNRIREAIWNLVDNAIKYTNRGGVTITSKIEDEKLKIAISDTGIGMDKEEIDYFLQGKLFERGEMTKKLYGPGRGMGLNLSIEFIKTHGGKIWAESGGRGKGTTFWIGLPIKVE
ncbi:MAG: ATP-binding protein [Candidatus Nealsonbacteria bacterium]|nr:ATP-binding protein [Candidatus Nealsonbacteria bacterium]